MMCPETICTWNKSPVILSFWNEKFFFGTLNYAIYAPINHMRTGWRQMPRQEDKTSANEN